MNGIKYIREKSNFTKYALAERMGVTRQTVTLWERGARRPDSQHLKWLCDFYGVEEKWFGDLSDEELETLNKKRMYRHHDGDKEYFSFIPEIDGFNEISVECGDLEAMLDERYADALRKKKVFMLRVEDYLRYSRIKGLHLFDKIMVMERGMKDIEEFMNLMDIAHEVGRDETFLKVPFWYEVKAVIYAMMVASGHYTLEEIKSLYGVYFINDYGLCIDEAYFNQLVELMGNHWNNVRDTELAKMNKRRKK